VMFKLDRGLPVLLTLLTVAACRGEDNASGTESASSTGGTEGVSTTDEPTPTTSGTTGGTSTSGDSDSGSTTESVTPTTTNESVGFITTMTEPATDTNTGPLPNGSQCADDSDCESMNCFSILGGMVAFCADCNEDQDCVDAGTGTACSLDIANQNAACTAGGAGSTCMSDDACADGLKCDAVINVPIPGLLPDTCGECSESGDCMDGKLCSPEFDFMAFSGQKSCVEPGSVMNNSLCPEGPDGPEVCMSGHCNMASIMGIVQVFICGECDDDGDCGNGQTCTPAEASMNGIMGSVCT
jgi:hypothetical protein